MQLFCSQRVSTGINMEQEEAMKKQVLEVCRDYLCQRLRLTTHISFLRSRSILSKDDDDEINAERTDRKRREKFLDIISTKGSRGYDEFCSAIRAEGTTGHLLEKLKTELRKLSVNTEVDGERDEAAEGLPKPGDPGAPPLPFPYTNNSDSRPYSYNSSQV